MSGNGAGKTQQVLFYETKVVEKNRVEERTSYPIGVIKKTKCVFFDANQTVKNTFTHSQKNKRILLVNSKKCPKIKHFSKLYAI